MPERGSSSAPSLAETILELKNLVIASGKHPTELHLPVALELKLEGCPAIDQSRFIVEGPQTFTHVLGLRIAFDANELTVA